MIEIINYEQFYKGCIIGFVDIRIVKWDLIIRKIVHMQKGDKKWFQFPRFKRGEEPDAKYLNYIEFQFEGSNQKLWDLLSEQVKLFKMENHMADVNPVNFDEELPF